MTSFDELIRLLIAYALALPIGWNRAKEARGAGLRTFPLVALGSCALILITQKIIPDSPDAQARVLAGLITGIGFIGGGAILKQPHEIHGTATAASIWAVSIIGAAVAYKLYVIAGVATLIIFLTLWALTPIKREMAREKDQ
jgi:putative Mg2+ transporter-C (MgtC) family protein